MIFWPVQQLQLLLRFLKCDDFRKALQRRYILID